MFVGREKEKKILEDALHSDHSEFIAVYGRRKIGKTFLIEEIYRSHFYFKVTGLPNISYNLQLKNFKESLIKQGLKKDRTINDWLDAFYALRDFIEQSNSSEKKVILSMNYLC